MDFSPYQTAIFEAVQSGAENLLVQARAGSGKTFTALHAIQYMKGEVISLAFNKKNAVELKNKVENMGLVNAKAVTFHSEGFANFRRGNRGYTKLENRKVFFIADDYTAQNEDENKIKSFITKIVSHAKAAGFGIQGCDCPEIDDKQAWYDLITHQDITFDSEKVSLERAVEIAIDVLKQSNRESRTIDFDDMLYLPLLREYNIKQYDWVVVDEAQDTNAVRKLLAKKMVRPGGRILIIGDEAQAIYGFTGAENDSMNLLKEQFQCKELPLPICYRCGSKIIEEAQQYVPDIEPMENAHEGIVRSEDYSEFIENVGDYNFDKNTGIICRNNAPLVALAFNLIRQGIGCRIEGRDIGRNLLTLTRKWKTNDLTYFTEKLSQYFEREMKKPANKYKLQLLDDKLETMIVLIGRCQELGQNTVKSLQNLIDGMFTDSDEKNVPNVVVLSSIHKAKGLEWDRCFVYGMKQFMPSRFAKQDWQLEQEENLKYVAITRAKNELVYVENVPSKKGENNE